MEKLYEDVTFHTTYTENCQVSLSALIMAVGAQAALQAANLTETNLDVLLKVIVNL